MSEKDYIIEKQKIAVDLEAVERRMAELTAAGIGGITDPEELVEQATRSNTSRVRRIALSKSGAVESSNSSLEILIALLLLLREKIGKQRASEEIGDTRGVML